MSRRLAAPDGVPRTIAPTTTAKIALRMLTTSSIIYDNLPLNYYSCPVLDFMLMMLISEEKAEYLLASEFSSGSARCSGNTDFWIETLIEDRMVEYRDDYLALSDKGYELITLVIEKTYAAQRELD